MSKIQTVGRWLWTKLGYQPFSWGSLLLLAGAYWSFSKIGVAQLDYVLVIVGAVALFLVAFGAFCTVVGSLYVLYCLQEHKEEKDISIVESFSCHTGFSLVMPWWLPIAQVSWTWEAPCVPIEIVKSGERVVFPRRGHWERIRRHFRITDLFGICRIRFSHESKMDVLVEANLGKLENPVFAQGMQAGGDMPHPMGKPYGDRVDIRNYAPGDPVRYILWKIYARTGQLVVRNPEKSLQPAERILAYLIASDRDSAAAGAAQATINAQGSRDDWKFGADGSLSIVTDRQQATDLITRSVDAEEKQGAHIETFIREAQDERFQSLIVFAPPEEGEWVDRVIKIRNKIQISIVIGIDSVETKKRFHRMQKLVFIQEDSAYECVLSKDFFANVVQRLQLSNIDVQIADRSSGMIVDADHMKRMLV